MTAHNKFLIGLALLAPVVLGACQGGVATNASLESIHQPVITRNNYVLDVTVAGSAIPVSEQRRIAEWFEALDLGYGDRISVDDPANSPAVRQMVGGIAARHGVLVADTAPVTTGSVAPGGIRIVVTRSHAYVPGCPDWSAQSDANPNNATGTNYGCSTNSNIAAMVADPEDLVSGVVGDDTADTRIINRTTQTYYGGSNQ